MLVSYFHHIAMSWDAKRFEAIALGNYVFIDGGEITLKVNGSVISTPSKNTVRGLRPSIWSSFCSCLATATLVHSHSLLNID